jgi:hypothetical protein
MSSPGTGFSLHDELYPSSKLPVGTLLPRRFAMTVANRMKLCLVAEMVCFVVLSEG